MDILDAQIKNLLSRSFSPSQMDSTPVSLLFLLAMQGAFPCNAK
jgi:hypothetical protein